MFYIVYGDDTELYAMQAHCKLFPYGRPVLKFMTPMYHGIHKLTHDQWLYLEIDFSCSRAAEIVVASFSLPSELNGTGTNLTESGICTS